MAYSRRNSVNYRMVSWLGAGIIPAAVVSALSNAQLPTEALTVLLATLITATGVNAYTKASTAERAAHSFGSLLLLQIGVVVGFGSALTGTGGPVLLVPILVFLDHSRCSRCLLVSNTTARRSCRLCRRADKLAVV